MDKGKVVLTFRTALFFFREGRVKKLICETLIRALINELNIQRRLSSLIATSLTINVLYQFHHTITNKLHIQIEVGLDTSYKVPK